MPLTILFGFMFVTTHIYLKKVPFEDDLGCWYPFACGVCIFLLCFAGLAYSYFPYIVPMQLDIYQAASARDSLMLILAGNEPLPTEINFHKVELSSHVVLDSTLVYWKNGKM